MTQKEAVEKALNILGGKASNKQIYPLAMKFADFSGSKTPEATIRNYLQTGKDLFRPSSKRGWWELVSYQEEVAKLKQEIADLKAEVADRDETIRQLKSVETADKFVGRLVKKVKTLCKRDKKTAEEIRILMDVLGRADAEKAIDDWLQGKDKKPVKKVTKKYYQKNINSQVFTNKITESEFKIGEYSDGRQ